MQVCLCSLMVLLLGKVCLVNATYTGGQSAGMSGSTGGIYVVADPTTISNVPEGNHFYDLELIQGNTIFRLVQGRFEVKGNTTR